MNVKAIITTLDNLANVEETIGVLRDEPLDEVVVVNNGSRDGTSRWLAELSGKHRNRHRGRFGFTLGDKKVTVINRENLGAGPGRNAGLDAAGEFDYVLMLDGGIRPLRGGTRRLTDYLGQSPEADVIGVEIADFETDYERAWRRWPQPILPEHTYVNTRLSHTAYCLCRAKAWDGLRFSEEGPFGEPGWGVDDDEMAYRWQEAGIEVHVITCQCRHGGSCTGVHPYRHASGSFRRLYGDTGIWPNQYGSVYEKRLVKLCQDWPQYQPGGNGPGAQWGEPWLTVVVRATTIEQMAKTIKMAHNLLRLRHFKKPYDDVANPYSVVLWNPDEDEDIDSWAQARRYRQHHGDTIILDEYGPNRQIVNKSKDGGSWTGDFRVWTGQNWKEAIRPGAFLYGLVEAPDDVVSLVRAYAAEHPIQPSRLDVPERRGEVEWPIIT
jgi:glycosyltransferase involved in cell wall biosynthesis